MSEETPNSKENVTEKTKESIEKLKNMDLAYVLALYLNHKYDFGGYSVGRSERSFLLDLFFNLNRSNVSKKLEGLNPFDNGELFLAEISKRLEGIEEDKKQMGLALEKGSPLDLNDKKIFSAIILKLWINHYRERIQYNDGLNYSNERDFSFESEIKRAQTLYDLYLSDLHIDEDLLEVESQKYVDTTVQTSKYTNDLKWHVDDLCKEGGEDDVLVG